MTTTIAEPNVYAEQFSTIVDRLPGRRLPWVRHLRKKAMEDFVALGFPTTKLENWRFTNVGPIQRATFRPAVDGRDAFIPDELRAKVYAYPEPRLVFVNGQFDPTLSALPQGVSSLLLTLGEALADCRSAVGASHRVRRVQV